MIYLETFILKKITIDDAEMKQDKFNAELIALSGYTPKGKKYIEGRKNFLDNAKNVYEMREKIIEGFDDGVFPLKSDDESEEQAKHKEETKNIRNENGLNDYKNFIRLIKSKETGTDRGLPKKYFALEIEDSVNLTLIIGQTL